LNLPEVDLVKHHYLEIQDSKSRRVVTVIELLSPSNKTPGADRDDYAAKRRQVLLGKTHFVKIDLRRGGERPEPPEIPAYDYYALTSRYEDRGRFCTYRPFSLRDPLPIISIPLSRPDPDVSLDLKDALDRTYDGAGYARYIYNEQPEPPQSASDAAWARGILAAAQPANQ
jgi:hypothetical protein